MKKGVIDISHIPERIWKVRYQIAPWPSPTKTIKVSCRTGCGASGIAFGELSKKYGARNVRLLGES